MSDPDATETVVYSITDEQGKVVLLLFLIGGIISLITATFGTLVFFYIRYKYPRLADRVTFRLALVTMISDFCVSGSMILASIFAFPGPVCTATTWGLVFFSLV